MENILLNKFREKGIVKIILTHVNFLEHRDRFMPTLDKILKYKQESKFYNCVGMNNWRDVCDSSVYLNQGYVRYVDEQITYIWKDKYLQCVINNKKTHIKIYESCDKYINVGIYIILFILSLFGIKLFHLSFL